MHVPDLLSKYMHYKLPAWAAFAKLKSILRSLKIKLNYKISLFKAACISILLYGCETWILTEELIEKPDIYARTRYRIMLGIRQYRDHVTNQSLYQLTGQVPLRETIHKRKLKFTGHCIRMLKEVPADRFVIYESRIKSSLRPREPRTTYLKQISSQIQQSGEKSLEAGEIRKMAVNKSEWSQPLVVSKKKKFLDWSFKLVRWWCVALFSNIIIKFVNIGTKLWNLSKTIRKFIITRLTKRAYTVPHF